MKERRKRFKKNKRKGVDLREQEEEREKRKGETKGIEEERFI